MQSRDRVFQKSVFPQDSGAVIQDQLLDPVCFDACGCSAPPVTVEGVPAITAIVVGWPVLFYPVIAAAVGVPAMATVQIALQQVLTLSPFGCVKSFIVQNPVGPVPCIFINDSGHLLFDRLIIFKRRPEAIDAVSLIQGIP